ncbi:MAG: flagellar basal body-associated FliL family protein [Pseudomonadales bacterium]
MKLIISLLASLMLLAPFSVSAQTQLEKPQYVELHPAFVTNYGSGERLHYLKVEISVRVESMGDAEIVERHLPYIRNDLVLLLSQQTSEAVNSHEGRQKLRAEALAAVKNVIKTEENKDLVTDLLFNNFVVQS